MRRLVLNYFGLAWAFVLTVGCGSNASDVPPELLDAIRDSEREATGTQVGDRVPNFCFEGWPDPARAGFDPGRLEPLCLHDFEDPSGQSAELLLVNAAALWCTACRVEYGGSGDRRSLAEQLEARQAAGFRILGTLFQDNGGEPATAEDAVTWATTYDVAFPFAIDPKFQLGVFTTPSQAPFNLLLDARNMEILLTLEGDQPAVLFSMVDDLLAQRSSE